MRKSNITLLTLAAAAAMVLGPVSADAKMHRTHPQRAVSAASISPRIAAARAESPAGTETPKVLSMAQDLAQGANGAGPKCKPGGKILLQDGLEPACQ
jgi:hypothetical protein